ncbi:Do family serine endopeptidase [Ignatzschineria rhizosphaerae]|uniref:Probable periplasmic serine endoprotease DegP-like n=1 Tax=Ignatzschineria rhizosphaerae TaxID=2923279 RepID=A0ABY3X1U8_9GAMM|nr:Do family serine endopeptidase [Ignatzschineria rhizosphaerae]UNM95860.1 Do family serine endopeptidase [Ignatzschineria rhizosphaerae]
MKVGKRYLTQVGLFLTAVCMLVVQQAFAQLPDWSKLFEDNKAAVVSITTEGTEIVRGGGWSPFEGFSFGGNSPFGDNDPFSFFFGEGGPQQKEQERIVRGAGSGFIIDKKGYVITNAHVIGDADKITVHLADRRELKAELIGMDEKTDVAVLKIEADKLPVVKIADVSKLKVGQWVMAVGSPFGLDYTATQGIISSLGRNLPNDNFTPFIQTDAAVNPGNSGGPLFNTEGEVIGINSQIYTSTGSYAGVSFAIPIDLAMHIVEQLREDGKVSRGWLGVQIQEVTATLAETFDLDKPMGALVASIVPESPADKSDLKVGDVILTFNGQEVVSSSQLPVLVSRVKGNEEVKVEVLRNGKRETIKVLIEALDDDGRKTAASKSAESNVLGVAVEETKKDARVKGVVITKLEAGIAQKAGLTAGDIITQINGLDIVDMKTFEEALKATEKNPVLRLLINRQGNPYFVAIRKESEPKK